MKYLCTETSEGAITLAGNSIDGIEVGDYYYIESAKSASQEQNKAFHALVSEYFKSRMHSYDVSNYEDFRNHIKKFLGAGFSRYVYVDYITKDYPFMNDSKNKEDLPKWIIEANRIKPGMIRGKLKSWSRYSKKERTDTIENLITEMIEAGVNSKKFEEIISGMEGKE